MVSADEIRKRKFYNVSVQITNTVMVKLETSHHARKHLNIYK